MYAIYDIEYIKKGFNCLHTRTYLIMFGYNRQDWNTFDLVASALLDQLLNVCNAAKPSIKLKQH